MNRLNIIRSSTWTPCVTRSSGAQPIRKVSGLNSSAEDLLTTAVTASTATTSAHRTDPSQRLSTRSRRLLWARLQPALSVQGMTAEEAATKFEPPAKPSAAAATAELPAEAAPALDTRQRSSPIARDELTIDSLRNYELVKSIPVVVESLGDRHYVAEVPDLNISTSASSMSDILIILKDRVTQTYEGLRLKKNLDSEQARQLRVLETYIGKSRRSWLDRH
jgi:hypothetical protein